MRLFKPTYKSKDGQRRTVRKWWVEMRDHLGIIRRFAGTREKAQTRILGQKIETLIGVRVAGEQPGPELSRWLQHIPPKLTEHFVSIGLLDAERAAGGKQIQEHLADFRRSLLAKGNTTKQADEVWRRATAVMDGCKFRTWSDIRADRVEQFLADLRSGKKQLSAQTSNHYLAAIKAFSAWMIQNRRATQSPLLHLKKMNVGTDRRHDRVALEVDEVRRLLAAAEGGPERFGMSGYERALLYRVTVETGLRRDELKSLQVGAFDLDRRTVTVRAAYSKHRREDVLPLRPETVEELRAFFTGKLPTVKAFGGRYKALTPKTAPMIYADLQDAGIEPQDDVGRFRDFHALRHTCGSWLAACGVHPKVAQAIMRHADINLTMSRYTHLLHGAEAEAVRSLPDLSRPAQESQRKTGTDGDITRCHAPKNLAENLADLGASSCNRMQSAASNTRDGDSKNAVSNAPGGARTPNLRFRRPTLYPIELQAQTLICKQHMIR